MKDYEIYSTMKVPKNSNIIIRLDGRKFHSLSKALNLVKPYDENFYKIIENVCLDIFNQFAPKFIYAFSDEISILLDEIPFSGRVEKINSVFASLASSSFTYNLLNDYSNEFDLDNLSDNERNIVFPISFDSRIIPIDDAEKYMKDAIKKTYGRKGEKIVNMNCAAVDAGIAKVHKVEVPASWADAADDTEAVKLVGRDQEMTDFLNDVMVPMGAMDGDSIPVSAFLKQQDGSIPAGTAAYEKRGIATDIPVWNAEKCVQCNRCSYVCPHAVIRPFAMTEAEAEGVDGVKKMTGKGVEDLKFTIAVSAMDCTGCGSCAQVCPVKTITMTPVDDELVATTQAKFDKLFKEVTPKELPFKVDSVKGSQFKQPLLEFNGACPGCGESPYAKLVTVR